MDALTKRMQENLLWYVRLRYTITFVLLTAGVGATLLLVGWDPVITRTLALGGVALVVNALIWLACRRSGGRLLHYKFLAVLQFLLDVLVVSYLIYAQGNVQQYATILFAIPIVASGFLFDRAVTIINGAIVIGVFSTLVIWDEFNYRPIELAADFSPAPAAYDFLVPIVFYGAAFMVLALMAERIAQFKRRGEAEVVREEILSLATHELRTPATSVKGYLALIHEGAADKLDAKQRRHLESAMDENNQQLRLVNNLLKTAMLDSSKPGLNYSQVNIISALRRVAAEQRYFASHKQVEVKINGKDIPIEADEDSVMVILGNLLHNALKYSPYKSRIDINLSSDAHSARVAFVDQGPGMTRTEKQQLFKRFSGHNKDDKVAGTGLGLYIAKMLTDKHNGRIGVNTKQGKGSEFFVELPLKKEETNEVLVS
jgi:signal transduction histidine kinase